MLSVFENQWILGSGSWLPRCPLASFPDEDHSAGFTNEGATLGMLKEALEPPRGVWLGEWEAYHGEDTDSDGWRYGSTMRAFTLPNSNAPGFGTSTHSHNTFLERGVRRRRWDRRFGTPASASPGGGASSAVAAAFPALPLSPPPSHAARERGSPAEPSAFLEALRGSLPIRSDSDPTLTPALVSSDLSSVNKLLQALRKAAGVASRSAASEARSSSSSSSSSSKSSPFVPSPLAAGLIQGAKELSLRLTALEAVCARKGELVRQSSGGSSGRDGSAWARLAGECTTLKRSLAEESAKLAKPPTPTPARAAAAAAAAAAVAGAANAGGGGGGPSHRQQQLLLQAQVQMSEAEWALQDASEREAEIAHIAREVGEVAQMFKDLNLIVHEQGESIEKIEETAAVAAEHAKKGVQEIQQANAKQRHSQVCLIA